MEAAGVEPAPGIVNTQVTDLKKGEKGKKGQKGESTVQTFYKIDLSSTVPAQPARSDSKCVSTIPMCLLTSPPRQELKSWLQFRLP